MKRFIPLIIGLVLGTGGGTALHIMGSGADEATAEGEVVDDHDTVQDTAHVAAADTTHDDTRSHDEPSETDLEDPADEQAAAIARALLADTGLAGAETGTPEADTHSPEDAATADAEGGIPAVGAVAAEDPTRSDVEESPAPGEARPRQSDALDATPGEQTGAAPTGANSSTDLIGGPVDNEEAAKRVAKIFSQMQARDAARVLSLMERSEVELIMKQLDNRSAAKILSGLSPEQAAALSAVLIRGGD